MDTAMRDLDQLRERGDETTGRKVGLFALAAVLSVAAIFAMSLMMQGGDEPAEALESDPLTALALAPSSALPAGAAPAAAAPKAPEVKPESLSFPSTLLDREDAILEATIRAAEKEHAALSGKPVSDLGSIPDLRAPSVADLPARSLATEDSARLARVAKHDPLVAETMPTSARSAPAPVGHEGLYTLQVVSYETRAEAEQFASALRARGHKAFVALADVPDRAPVFRVRIGPFSTRQEAIAYQDSFENQERMHTILVSNGAK
jgi:cell division septation protein DedD